MTWGFQTCGPNEAMVVSGEISLTDSVCREIVLFATSQDAVTENLSWFLAAEHLYGLVSNTFKGRINDTTYG